MEEMGGGGGAGLWNRRGLLIKEGRDKRERVLFSFLISKGGRGEKTAPPIRGGIKMVFH